MMKTALVVVGTRPEAIKLAPVIRALSAHDDIDVHTCVTGQHETLWRDAFDVFGIQAAMVSSARRPGAPLREEFARILQETGDVLATGSFDLVIVQGDTTSAYAAALAAFYAHVPVAHVEAGLRTHDPLRPWPEEIHRRAIAPMVTWHFAPSALARDNLMAEGAAPEAIWVVGNTVIDALQHVREVIARERASGDFAGRLGAETPWLTAALREVLVSAAPEREVVVVTMHRRETFERHDVTARVRSILWAALHRDDALVVWPMHPSEGVRRVVRGVIEELDAEVRARVVSTPPWPYVPFVALLERASVVLTDSGGIQEEAPVLRTPVVVLREATERVEVLDHGAAALAPDDPEQLGRLVERLVAGATPPQVFEGYGRGDAGARISNVLASALRE